MKMKGGHCKGTHLSLLKSEHFGDPVASTLAESRSKVDSSLSELTESPRFRLVKEERSGENVSRLVLGRPALAIELADDGVDHGENLETVAPSSSKKEEDGVLGRLSSRLSCADNGLYEEKVGLGGVQSFLLPLEGVGDLSGVVTLGGALNVGDLRRKVSLFRLAGNLIVGEALLWWLTGERKKIEQETL